jgi:hypothetical protein
MVAALTVQLPLAETDSAWPDGPKPNGKVGSPNVLPTSVANTIVWQAFASARPCPSRRRSRSVAGSARRAALPGSRLMPFAQPWPRRAPSRLTRGDAVILAGRDRRHAARRAAELCAAVIDATTQAITLPSCFGARVWRKLAAIANHAARSRGRTLHWPGLLPRQPRATTLPFCFRATLSWPQSPSRRSPPRQDGAPAASRRRGPGAITLPSCFRAGCRKSPAHRRHAARRRGRTVHCPKSVPPRPQATAAVPGRLWRSRARSMTPLVAADVALPDRCRCHNPGRSRCLLLQGGLWKGPAATAVRRRRRGGTVHADTAAPAGLRRPQAATVPSPPPAPPVAEQPSPHASRRGSQRAFSISSATSPPRLGVFRPHSRGAGAGGPELARLHNGLP